MESDDTKVAALVKTVILLLKEEKIRDALIEINRGIAYYGDRIILIRARGEAELAAANFLSNLDSKEAFIDHAEKSANKLLELLPGAIDFLYFHAKVLACKGCLRNAIAICDQALISRDCDEPDHYEGMELSWDGEPLESTCQSRKKKVMEGIYMFMKELKTKLLRNYLHSTKVSVLFEMYLEPTFNALQCSLRNVPDCVSRYWISLDVIEKIEHRHFNVFDFIKKVGNESQEDLLLDCFYKFSISKEWKIWVCSECPMTFSNAKDHGYHVIREHIGDITEYCHEDLPYWGKKKIQKIWGPEHDLREDESETWKTLEHAKMFELKMDDEYFLRWLYEKSSIREVVCQWEEKVAHIKFLTEECMECIRSEEYNMKQACSLLQFDQIRSEKEEMSSKLKLMKSQCDLTENLMKLGELCKVDNRFILEPFIKYYLQDCLEEARVKKAKLRKVRLRKARLRKKPASAHHKGKPSNQSIGM